MPAALPRSSRRRPNLRAAVDGADIIIIVTGGNAQEDAARLLAPLLRDGQLILLIQGNTGGSLVVRRALDASDCHAAVDIAEMDNYPYSCRRLAPTRIRPIVAKRWLQIASFPGNRIGAVFPRLSPLFPQAVAAPISSPPASPTRMRCCTSPTASPMPHGSKVAADINSMPRG